MRYIFAVALFMAMFAGLGCDSSENLGPESQPSQDAGQDVQAEATPDALADSQDAAQAEATPDVLAEATSEASAEASPDAELDTQAPEAEAAAPNKYPECLLFTDDHILRAYLFEPVAPERYVSLFGWINFPAAEDTTYKGICWTNQPGMNELRCELKDAKGDLAKAETGTKVELTPGVSLTNGGDQVSWFCIQDDCSNIKIMVLCDGQTGIGRIDDGVITGSVIYNPNGQGGVNPLFTLP